MDFFSLNGACPARGEYMPLLTEPGAVFAGGVSIDMALLTELGSAATPVGRGQISGICSE
jgi:hypothetical protein